jgi:cell division protein FtsB
MKQSLRTDARLQRGAILALALVCIFFIVHEIFGEHGYLALRREQRDLSELQQQIQQLQQENKQLELQINALKSDPKAIEKQAREGLGLARPGEIIFTLPEKHSESDKSSATAKDTTPKEQ